MSSIGQEHHFGQSVCWHNPRKGTRIARDEHGKNVFVPVGMRYEDWKKKYVDGSKLLIQDVTKRECNAMVEYNTE